MVAVKDEKIAVSLEAGSQMQKTHTGWARASIVRREQEQKDATVVDEIKSSETVMGSSSIPALYGDDNPSPQNFQIQTECCGEFVCAVEGGDCCCRGDVRMGSHDDWTEWRKVDHWITCHSDIFKHTGDSEKYCECRGYCPVTCDVPTDFLNNLPNLKTSSCLEREESEDVEFTKKYKPGDTCSLECNSGYRPSSESLQCRTDRYGHHEHTWSPKNLTCEGQPCQAPRNIANAINPTCSEGSHIMHGTACKTSCQTGFIPSAAVLNCNFGVLEPQEFFCEPLSCGLQGVSIDFQHPLGPCEEGDLVQHGSQCHARCIEGYEPSVSTLTCELGVFSPAMFQCREARCSIPSGIANAAALPCAEFWTAHRTMKIPHGQTCTATCRTGYDSTAEKLNCSYGVLSPPTFECFQGACAVPSGIANGAEDLCREGTQIQHNGQCTAQCKDGYLPSVPTLACHAGAFYPAKFACHETPCAVPLVEHAYEAACRDNPVGEAIASGESCTPHCRPGWKPTAHSLSCSKGLFDPPTYQCSDSECLAPNGIENAAEVSCREGTDIKNGNTCTAQCQPGYEPSVVALHCAETMLEPYSFVCNPLMCSLPKDVLNAADELCEGNPDSLASGSSCKPRCKDGFAPSERKLSCDRGELSTTNFKCHQARPCSADATTVMLGDVSAVASPCWEGSVIENNEHCHAICQTGHTPSVEKLSCDDGQLTPANFTCTPNSEMGHEARCVAPVGIAYAQFVPCTSEGDSAEPKISFKDGERCIPRCEPEYSPSEEKLTCNGHLGSFTPHTFTCKRAAEK